MGSCNRSYATEASAPGNGMGMNSGFCQGYGKLKIRHNMAKGRTGSITTRRSFAIMIMLGFELLMFSAKQNKQQTSWLMLQDHLIILILFQLLGKLFLKGEKQNQTMQRKQERKRVMFSIIVDM